MENKQTNDMQKEENINKKTYFIYNAKNKIKNNEKIITTIFLILLISFIFYILCHFFISGKEKIKNRYLNSEMSEIIITLYSDDATTQRYFLNDVDPHPDEIIINNVDVTSSTRNSLKYTFPFGENNVILRWHNVQMTSCNNMFSYLKDIKRIDLSNFDSSKVTDTTDMFFQCQGVEEIILDNFDTSLIEDMNHMFSGCNSLTSLDLSSFDTSKVKNMGDMFTYAFELLSIDLSNFDTSLVINMKHMFMDCHKLTSINLSGFITTSVTGFNVMFKKCQNLISIDLSHFDTSNAESLNSLFSGCEKLETVLQNFDTSKCTNANEMFFGCKSLVSLDISNFDFSNTVNMGAIFENCENLEYLNLNQLLTLNKVTDLSYLFYGCKKLQNLDLSFLDTSQVTNMASLFCGCENLKYLNILNFDYSLVTDISNMFDGCKSLQYLNMYSFIDNINSETSNIFNEINPNLLYCIMDTSKATNIISLLNEKKAVNDCSNDCFFKNVTYILEEDLCIQNCDNYDYKYKYNNKCYRSCENFISFDQKECIDEIPEGYYINNTSLKTINKCPEKCELCSYDSMINNLCISCNNHYLIINNDLFYDCILNCPEGYIERNNMCEISFKIVDCNENDYILVSNNSCIDKCNSLYFFSNICKGKNNDLQIKQNLINSIREDITSGNLISLLENVTNNEKMDIEIVQDDVIYQITSTFNQDNKKYDNISIIKLKECERRLKSLNELNEDDSLIIFKVDLNEKKDY